jgi:sugar lactone lactonase YvrE
MAWHNHKLRRIDPSGNSHIVAGAGVGFAGDNGPQSMALFKQPSALEIDDQGNQYLIDQGNWRIRKIDPAGIITTFAGTGVKGFAGDSGPASAAQFGWDSGSNPEPNGGLAHQGNRLFVSDTLNHRIRVIDLSTGIIDTLAGNGTAEFSGDGADAKAAGLNHPRDLEVGPDGNLYVADTDNHRIRMIDLKSRQISTVAGSGELGLDEKEGLKATQTKLRRPFGLGFDAQGALYVCDTLNSRILRVTR